MTLGTKLGKLRRNKNLSQFEIAEQLDISQNAYNKWESDKTKPNIENLFKISVFYNLSIYNLLDDVSNIDTTGLKIDGNHFNSELIEEFQQNQEQITKLIENQNKLIESLLKN